LLFVLIGLAQRTGLAPRIIAVRDYHRGRLEQFEEDRFHRPIYFLVDDDMEEKEGGPRNPNQEPPLWLNEEDELAPEDKQQVQITPRALAAWYDHKLDMKRAHEPGTEWVPEPVVAVTHYKIGEYEYFDVRLDDPRLGSEPVATVYDNRQLPRYLFVGAALMTLGALVMLCRMQPDLIQRAVWVLRSPGRRRVQVFGTINVPGDGPALLATNAADARALASITSATDREVFFLTEPVADEAARRLRKGAVVGAAVGATDLGQVAKGCGAPLLPVY